MARKPFEDEDPMELIALALPDGDTAEMVECIVEEFVRMGLDDRELMCLFRSPIYYTPHAIYREKGEDYVNTVIQRMREKWGVHRFTVRRQEREGSPCREGGD
jgi:hypothetical protein